MIPPLYISRHYQKHSVPNEKKSYHLTENKGNNKVTQQTN